MSSIGDHLPAWLLFRNSVMTQADKTTDLLREIASYKEEIADLKQKIRKLEAPPPVLETKKVHGPSRLWGWVGRSEN
jgi:cell division protein FtsL